MKLLMLILCSGLILSCKSETKRGVTNGVDASANKNTIETPVESETEKQARLEAELAELEAAKAEEESKLGDVEEQIEESEKAKEEVEKKTSGLNGIIAAISKLLDSDAFRQIIDKILDPALKEILQGALDSKDPKEMKDALTKIIGDLVNKQKESKEEIEKIDEKIEEKKEEMKSDK
ncbi:MAG: hypothetical protein HRU19_02785 [Pseudobacteriovorax sp.]|nr:hypothetical protein [Pseudobacteriovorax sp.]